MEVRNAAFMALGRLTYLSRKLAMDKMTDEDFTDAAEKLNRSCSLSEFDHHRWLTGLGMDEMVGMDEMEFSEAESNMNDLVSEY